MKIIAKKLSDSRLHFVTKNVDGNEVHVDGKPEAGGEGKGMRPMELVLSALLSCSAMDLLVMLEKQKMNIDSFKIECSGTRTNNAPSTPFTAIHIVYMLGGTVDLKRAQISAKLSLEKYCSVADMLRPKVAITHEVQVINE